eukprot:4051218-Pleurochrysis_carterae.AAC.4
MSGQRKADSSSGITAATSQHSMKASGVMRVVNACKPGATAGRGVAGVHACVCVPRDADSADESESVTVPREKCARTRIERGGADVRRAMACNWVICVMRRGV